MSRVSRNMPKCMLEVGGKPVIGYMIDACLHNRINEFIIAIKSGFRSIIEEYIFNNYIKNGFEFHVEYDEQTTVSGTGPACLSVWENHNVGTQALVMWGDMISGYELPRQSEYGQCSMVVFTHGNCSRSKRFDEVKLDSEGRVVEISKPCSDLYYRANSGIYCIYDTQLFFDTLKEIVYSRKKDEKETPFEYAVNIFCKKYLVYPRFLNMFIDIGTEEAYLNNKAFIERLMIR